MRTLYQYEDTKRWHDWAEEYYEERILERVSRRMERDNEDCGYVPQEEGECGR